LFDTKLLQPGAAGAILDQARDMLILRNLQALGQVSSLPETNLKLEAHTAALQDAQLRDGLTGLYNRGYLDLMLRREFQAATTGHWPLSVVFVDLDRFKGINETYGHEAGDSVLVTTAKSIASVARDTDCVARYGGEEFAVVLPEAGIAGAQAMLGRVRRSWGAQQPITTFSAGIAGHERGRSPRETLRLADGALYAAKDAGRDCDMLAAESEVEVVLP
jgi:diguanylate cyclase (GGDEF)-like protein